MHLKELNDRSPLRLLEESIHGGLGPGNLGVVVARHGVGKTAFLVGVAMDDLFRGRRVLHVSIGRTIEHIREYYDEVFFDLAHKANLDGAAEIRRDMERRRHIKAFLKGTFSIEKLREHIDLLRDVLDFTPAAVMMDGYDFDSATPEGLDDLRAIAKGLKAELWMSAHTHRESKRDAEGIPEPVAAVKGSLDVILAMAHDGKSVHLRLLKDHDNPDVSELSLALDPTTMLLVKK